MIHQLKNLYKSSFNHPGLHWLEIIYLNYYWVLVVGAVINIFFHIPWFADTFFPLLIYALFFLEQRKIKVNYFDYLWLMYFIVVVFSWIINDYPYKSVLIIRCLSEQFAYSLCYWIVRKNPRLSANNIIECAYFPLFITSIIGIYCYFSRPSWYVGMIKTDQLTDFMIMESLRLRSIFPDSYIISYFLGITIVFLLTQIVRGKIRNQRIANLFLGIFAITLFITLTRSIIGAVLIGFIIVVIYASKYKMLKMINPILLSTGIIFVVVSILIMNLDGYEKDFFLSKIESVTDDNASETITNRFLLNKNVKGIEYGFVGDGVGRHNMYADKYIPKSSLRDGEYNKLIVEQGYIGFFVFVLIIVASLLKCTRNFKNMVFEFIMIIFLLLAMIAANPISTGDKHPLIYWIIIGQVANYKNKYENLYNNSYI